MAPDRVSAGLGARGGYIVHVDWPNWMRLMSSFLVRMVSMSTPYTLLSPTVPTLSVLPRVQPRQGHSRRVGQGRIDYG